MYDFKCTKCEHVFEDITPSDGPFPVCPECGEPSERQMSAPIYAAKRMSRKGAMHAERHKRLGTNKPNKNSI